MAQVTQKLAARTKATALGTDVRPLAVMAVLGMVGHGLAMTITGPSVPEIMTVFSVRETAVGLMLSAGSLGFMLGCLLGGFVIDEIGLKPVLLVAWFSVVATLAGFALSGSFVLLAVMYGLLGLASGIIETALNVLPAQIGAGAGMMNLIHVGYGIGALVAPIIVGLVLDIGASWRISYWLITLLPVLLLIRGWLLRMPAAPKTTTDSKDSQPILVVLRHPLVILSASALLFYVAAELSVSNWIVLFMQRKFALPPFLTSASLSVFWLLILVGRLAQGKLSEHFSLPALIVTNGALFGLALAVLALSQNTTIAWIALALAGLGGSGIYPNVMVYANSRYTRQVGAVTGVLSMMAAVGSFAFQPVIGRVAESYGLSAAFLLLAACMAVSAASYLPVWLGKVRA